MRLYVVGVCCVSVVVDCSFVRSFVRSFVPAATHNGVGWFQSTTFLVVDT